MARPWYGTLAVLTTFALVSQLWLVIDRDGSVVNYWSYFTVESNLLVCLTSWLLVLRSDRGGALFGVVRLAALVGITVTGIVYATVLAGQNDLDGLDLVNDVLFHYVSPALSVLGFFLVRPRARFGPSPWWFLVWPFGWLGYTLVRAEVAEPVYRLTATANAPVPYGFLDVGEHGGWSVAGACVVVAVVAIGLAALYVQLGRRAD